MAQLTYAYALSAVEVAPVEPDPGPAVYTLCQEHLDRLSVPKGWRLVATGTPGQPPLSPGEILALAAAIREAGGLGDEPYPDSENSLSQRSNLVMLGARAHLRVVADSARYSAAK